MNQKKYIKQELLKGRIITPMDMLNECGCYRLGARIFELRREGMDIRMKPHKYKRYAQYYMGEPTRRIF
jgi:hypothetical protein